MPHTHEIQLGDGETVTTSEETEVGGAEALPEELPGGPLPGELRAPVPAPAPKRKAAAIKSTDLPALEAEEKVQAQKALEAGDASQLPEYAKTIFKRMYASALRWSKSERKASAAAWRAVRQKYQIGPGKAWSAEKRAAGLFLLDHFANGVPRKSFIAGTIAGLQGGDFLVRFTEEKNADVLYERTEQIPVPGLDGVLVLVGHSPPNHRNLINVRVPKGVVSGTPGGQGAINFVREHLHTIWAAGKGQLLSQITTAKRAAAPHNRASGPSSVRRLPRPLRPRVKFVRKDALGSSSFVDDPSQATERIAYSEDYVPWEVDLQGEYASEKEIEDMCHGYCKNRGAVGEMHGGFEMSDGQPPGHTVEGPFIARRGDPDFTPGAMVRAVEYHPEVWEKILSGEYQGTSIAGRWASTPIFQEG